MKTDMKTEDWIKYTSPAEGLTVRWNEPLWAPPTKARGKQQKMGEQRVTATILSVGDVLEFHVLDIQKISGGGTTRVQAGDVIRRKPSTLDLGNCYQKRD